MNVNTTALIPGRREGLGIDEMMELSKELLMFVQESSADAAVEYFETRHYHIRFFMDRDIGEMMVVWSGLDDFVEPAPGDGRQPKFVSYYAGSDAQYIEVFPAVGAWEGE